VTFEAEFEGGRRLLATTDSATYTTLLGAAFDYKPPQERAALDQERKVETGPIKKSLPFILGLFVLAGIVNGSPLAWGIAVGGAVFIVGKKIARKLNTPTIQTEPQSPELKL
jgi:hypothetical protein